jgi:hypothetical protein
MSSFLGPTAGQAGACISQSADDKRGMANWYQMLDTAVWLKITEPFDIDKRGFANGYWPGGVSLDASGQEWQAAIRYDFPDMFTGTNGRYAFVGVTRDGYGTAVGGVTVKLFKTVGGGNPDLKDVKIDETVSDVNGNFQVTTPYYPDTHYLVTYKSGTPDIQGTTVNTLIGA